MTDKSAKSSLQAPSTSVDEGLRHLLEMVQRAAPMPVPLERAQGLVLAQAIVSDETHPADDTSAMDGYAVRAEDLAQASSEKPVDLRMGEDIAAGAPPESEVTPGTCSRISTGGLVPEGADAVIMRELVEVIEGKTVRFHQPCAPGANIRRAGEHLKPGDRVIPEGRRLGPSELGMAAYLGHTELHCFPAPVLAVLATGNELAEPGQPLARGQVRDSNGLALTAAAQQLGCTVGLRGRVGDSAQALVESLRQAAESCQVILTSGGISAGWHDLVRSSIESLGGEFAFHKLRMRPGKPVAFGRLGKAYFFCLPGNPVSSLVTFQVFVKPALLKMMGRPFQETYTDAVLEETIRKKRGFTIFFRGIMESTGDETPRVRLTGPQGSHQLRSMVDANVLIRTEEESERLEAGTRVKVQLLR